ncbi:MAG: hypothetical protein JWM68_4251 [Verrucomicrobiales bacterium]|nr:hypothetical protein [Verrucomicrobiales bacterium]
MNEGFYPSPSEQIRLHWLCLIGEAKSHHRPHVAFHLKGIVRALKQLVT